MHNFSLLKEVGRSHLPVLLKRGFSATINELIMSAEYILSEGNMNVLLCERGIRTFETATRYTLDLNAVPILKAKTHLPVVVDPTHGVGLRDFIPQMWSPPGAGPRNHAESKLARLAKSDGEQAIPRMLPFCAAFARGATPSAAIFSRILLLLLSFKAALIGKRAPLFKFASSG